MRGQTGGALASPVLMLVVTALLLSGKTAAAQNMPPPVPPDVVKLPAGTNLGTVSFYDGVGSTDPGLTVQYYTRLNHFTSIMDSSGRDSPLFVNPRIDVMSNIIQALYNPPISVPGGAIGIDTIMPITDFQSHFDPRGLVLRDNGFNMGDLTFGPFYQAKPVMVGGRQVLSWRAEIDFIAPTGGFDPTRDINQSSGFWSINPYISVTVLPLPRWEVSARFNYIYNFSTSRGTDPPVIRGFTFRNGQAGQAVWINFASSYEIAKGIRPGIDGFWQQQFTDDRTNGVSVPNTLVEQFYLGPGLSWEVNQKNIVNFNFYLPVSAKNVPAGPEFNLQYIHTF
jgi:hypothetical protein